MLFKDMNDADLIEAYWWTRNTMSNNSDMARSVGPGTRTNRTLARQMGKLIRDFDIICAILRQRRINPLKPS